MTVSDVLRVICGWGPPDDYAVIVSRARAYGRNPVNALISEGLITLDEVLDLRLAVEPAAAPIESCTHGEEYPDPAFACLPRPKRKPAKKGKR